MDAFTEPQWRAIFAGLGSAPDGRSVTATTTGQPMYPYFNSGVVAVPREHCAALFAAWMQAMEDLDELWRREPDLIPPARRFYTEQLALAVALWRGLPWTAASRELNFPTHVDLHEPTVAGMRPALLHYHAEVDRAGFLLRPRCRVAEAAAERVNRSRADALGLPYKGLQSRPLADRARLLVERSRIRAQAVRRRIRPASAT